MTEKAPDLSVYKRLLIYGGSFDPPHMAHLTLPSIVAKQIGADVVCYIPAARSPHKLDLAPTDPWKRVQMLRLALAERADALVLTDEVQRGEDGRPSYTVETLEALGHRVAPDAELRLLIGADQLPSFHTWRQVGRITQLAEPVVMVRPPWTMQTVLDALPDDADRTLWEGRLVETPAMEVSSTMIRENVAAGRSIDGLTPEPVAQYIATHGLYANAG